MEIVRARDIGTLQYDTYVNDDENLAPLMEAIIATGAVGGELLGEPSAELRSRFGPGGPVQLFSPWLTMEPPRR